MDSMDTVKGQCFTKLTNYEMTINEFYRVPLIGELVACERNGDKMGQKTQLRVCNITHTSKNGKPYIIVELHH